MFSGNSGGGLFGGSSTTPAASGGGLFGSTPAATPAASGGGLFGSTPAAASGGGLFGSTPAATPAASGGLFGAKPAATPVASSGGLFGAKPAETSTVAPAATTTVTAAPQATGIDSIIYDRMEDTLTVWEKRMKHQVTELGHYYQKMTTIDEEIEKSHKMMLQLDKEQDEVEREQHELCMEMKALESKQVAIGANLMELESSLGQIIDARVNRDSTQSYLVLTDDHPSATLQDHFHAVTKSVEKAEARSEAYQKRLAGSLNNLAQMNGFNALIELLNVHQVALDGMSDQLESLLQRKQDLQDKAH